jgi:pyruvate dehydrogenase E2 component (dihydrolipoamide acetyltransferase)
MPSLGSDMEAATLIEWLVEPGARMQRGDLIAVVETEKGAIEIEVYEDGQLGAYLVELGSEVEVGAPLAEIISDAEEAQEVAEPKISESIEPPTRATPASAPPAPRSQIPNAVPEGLRASPAARRLAASNEIDLTSIAGTGPEAAVILADVERAIEGTTEAAPREARRRETAASGTGMEGMRRAIAAAMARSKREIPHYYLSHTVDLEPTLERLATANEQRGPNERLLAGALFLRATALALRDFPEFNGTYEQETFRASERIHVGTAIAIRGGGLVAPAIHDADKLGIDELMQQLRDLTTRVRAGRFRSSELRDPTVTVTSLGERGVEKVQGVIYPPQVACVGFGKVVLRPWSLPDASIVSRRIVTITLSADHRVSDGRRGARLLNAIGELLQRPDL